MLAHSTPVIDPDELIVGRPCYRKLDPDERAELDLFVRELEPAVPGYPGQASHMAIDYEKLLTLGVSGVRAEVEKRLREPTVAHPEGRIDRPRETSSDAWSLAAGDAAEFYRACLVSLDGLLLLAERYAARARALARATHDGKRRDELDGIAEVLDRVPAHPAKSFREALQSVHFVTAFLEGLYQLGRPDRYLIDLYRRDVSFGRIDEAHAQELIDCLCLLFNEYIPGGLAVGFMIGGADASGTPVTNELTRMFLESIGHTRMIYPGIGLCCVPGAPEDLLVRSCELLRDGHTHPALFNDRIITEGLRGYGLSPSEACEYIHSTCVEITPIASSAVWVASPYINLLDPLLELLGIDAGTADVSPVGTFRSPTADAWRSFDDFTSDYRIALGRRVNEAVAEQNRMQAERSRTGGDALVSCFVRDCLERGRDVDRGGARYNWIMPSFVGMANLIDSLSAIRELVFRRRRIGIDDVARALRANFVGSEDLLRLLRDGTPAYGNDDDAVDSLASEVTGWIREALEPCRTYRGDRFIPSLFCWIMHEKLGSDTPATPDGRRAGFPLGDGSGPAQGRERAGPTASILSSTKWDHRPFIGGIAVNLKLSRRMFPDGSVAPLVALVRTYLERGGFELQVNVVGRETLLAAREHPEEYADLVVRIGGYSDYFTKLSPAMQEEVILRTEHGAE